MSPTILSVNVGSSSIKFAVFERVEPDRALRRVVRGAVSNVLAVPEFKAWDGTGARITDETWDRVAPGHENCFARLLVWIESHVGEENLIAVGHRVIHGGTEFDSPVQVDDEILKKLEKYVPFARLHQPHSLATIRCAAKLRPHLPQVACFDTSFHCDRPLVAKRFAIPRQLEAEGIWRYGFHGLSYEFISGELRRIAPHVAAGRVIAAHMGAGVSLCAMRDGRSVDTTTGLTALDGPPMATRCGAIDPGVLLYLLREHDFDVDALEDLLYNRCGLLGISGVSGDMRALLDSKDRHAFEAIDLFVYRVVREMGALTASLQGLDGLVFTGGIGEHSPEIRGRMCERLAWLGIEIDESANLTNAPNITGVESRVSLRVIPTDEEAVIARQTDAVVSREAVKTEADAPAHELLVVS